MYIIVFLRNVIYRTTCTSIDFIPLLIEALLPVYRPLESDFLEKADPFLCHGAFFRLHRGGESFAIIIIIISGSILHLEVDLVLLPLVVDPLAESRVRLVASVDVAMAVLRLEFVDLTVRGG